MDIYIKKFFKKLNNKKTKTKKKPGYKFSHAIYTSWLTGKPSYNYHAKHIVGDSLFASMYRAQTGCRASGNYSFFAEDERIDTQNLIEPGTEREIRNHT